MTHQLTDKEAAQKDDIPDSSILPGKNRAVESFNDLECAWWIYREICSR